MRVHVLRMHAAYQCEHAGVCCTAGWGVPVDAPLYGALTDAIASSRLQVASREPLFVTSDPRSTHEPVLLGQRSGACVFFEPGRGNLCAIHRQLGHAHLPSACRHFPRVTVLDPRGVLLSLSCLCPTAGRLLTQPMPQALDVVSSGRVITPGVEWEGLDARDTLPPRLSADILWDWEGLSRWEHGIFKCLSTMTADHALTRVTRVAGRIERWRPSQGVALAHQVDAVFDGEPGDAAVSGRPREVEALDHLARASVTAMAVPDPPVDQAFFDRRFVEPGWRALQPVVARYVAARAMANWVGYHASSASSWAASLLVASAVLRTESARQCAAAGRTLDEQLLVAAAAEADRLLVHMAQPAELARRLDDYVR